ncbi:GNAT family N-acetyltransferase [Gordonia jinghuaiqii]|uniref:GNAT family N-acetyltransferase n=1 Tax=Gordonia jinghuaiqii TaxID=2758710 RepID=A0A7D7R1E5_9ACTN|nr:GNAT family N-acyltransferase [Gordonia jinghuaiqii]MCR5977016.1 GNAT family N-acetyltransferase [Gordonia jinghuaiqii]QMT00372.1 GNAT family N-acetyltransferase [Gordonia jinghuaiqii]
MPGLAFIAVMNAMQSAVTDRVARDRFSRAVPSTLLSAGPIRVVVSDDPADIVAAQELRYRVFADEPGFSDRIGDSATGRDADRFDAFCEHLVVRHADEGVIGCARLLAPSRAIAAGGWYSATEFDLREMNDIVSDTVELGRACVHADHRDGSVTALMWAALLQYMDQANHRYLMGCVSVPLYSPGEPMPGSVLRAVRDRLNEDHRESGRQAFPLTDPRIGGRPLENVTPSETIGMPPLMRGYLRVGARICGEPAVDDVFDVADFLTLLDREGTNKRYLDRLRSAAQRLGRAQTATDPGLAAP